MLFKHTTAWSLVDDHKPPCMQPCLLQSVRHAGLHINCRRLHLCHISQLIGYKHTLLARRLQCMCCSQTLCTCAVQLHHVRCSYSLWHRQHSDHSSLGSDKSFGNASGLLVGMLLQTGYCNDRSESSHRTGKSRLAWNRNPALVKGCLRPGQTCM